MATAPTSPVTWTAIPAADPLVGPGVAYASVSNGTIFVVPGAPNTLVFTTTEITPNVTEVDWQVIAPADDSIAAPMLFASIDTTIALYFGGGALTIAEGA